MKIVYTRRISQLFFLLLFFWLCFVASLGTAWWQLRGWPVNWFIHADPLAALGVFLTTRTVQVGFGWAVAVIALTVIFGRFFCGWICPFGTLHQYVGWLSHRRRPLIEKVKANDYRPAQRIKYSILAFLLAVAFVGLIADGAKIARMAGLSRIAAGSLQTGLLDPISLMYRSANLVLLPLADRAALTTSLEPRWYAGAGLIGFIFIAALMLNIWIPRFYCRFVCPLGALFGVIGRWSLWRIGKTNPKCSMCMECESHCEGACEPSTKFRPSECVLCMNCLRACEDNVIAYRTYPSAGGEVAGVDLTRRGLIVSIASGALAIPILRLNNLLGANWNPRLIRPPGALPEEPFMDRCLKCGQCMRICPTNIIQPAGLEAGLEGVWTPTLNFRIGTSGCQLNCVACGQVCPTAAIRPITLDEKLGRNAFTEAGPIRLGTAFVDQGRCLPWAMDRPCIVCQENCPVSPKAIFVREVFIPVREGTHVVAHADELTIDLGSSALAPNIFTTGDYYCRPLPVEGEAPHRIVANTDALITIDPNRPFAKPLKPGVKVEVLVRLQRPVVDPRYCIGCGVCEHECPVTGIKAIRVTAENESRNTERKLLP